MRGGLGCPDDLRRDDLAVTTFAVTTLAVTTFAVSKLAVTTFAVTTLAVTTFAVACRPHYRIFELPVACRPLYRVYVNQQFHQTVLLDLPRHQALATALLRLACSAVDHSVCALHDERAKARCGEFEQLTAGPEQLRRFGRSSCIAV